MTNTTPGARTRKCQERLRQINEYIDGEIDEDLCEEIERHMEKCPDCQLIVDTLTRTIKFYRVLAQTHEDLPEGVEERLLQKINIPHVTC